jgi:hypothetical protein
MKFEGEFTELAACDLTGVVARHSRVANCSCHNVAGASRPVTRAGGSQNPRFGAGSRTRLCPRSGNRSRRLGSRSGPTEPTRNAALGYDGSEGLTRRAIEQVRAALRCARFEC